MTTTPRRLRPAEHPGIDLRKADPRVVWASSAKASSEWSSSYSARGACGPPTIYPEGGDLTPSWLAANDDRRPWIELAFPETDTVVALLVCETCGSGAVTTIEDLDAGDTVYSRDPEKIERSREAHLLLVPLAPRTAPTRLRLRLAPYSFGSEYHEIDAVGLLRVPFDELRQPYVPPPPPPTPEELLTVVRGRLSGPTPHSPLVHAKVRQGERCRAASIGPPLRLSTDDGMEVEVLVGETALYGVPVVRARGRWSDVAREHPMLARAFSGRAPRPDDEVVAELRALTREADVELAGEPGSRVEGGFRDAGAGAPRTITARALSCGPIAASAFRQEGLAGFARMTVKARPRPGPSPMDPWPRVLAIAAASSLLGLLAAVGLLGPEHWVSATLACLAILPCVHGAELVARVAAIPEILPLPVSHRSDRRPPLVGVGWSLVSSGLGLVFGFPAFAFTMLSSPHPASPALAFVAAAGALALVRLALTLRAIGRTLLSATRLALARERARPGQLAALTGTLGEGEHHREEDYVMEVEHLGTYTTTDAQGRHETHDRFRSWYERRVRVRGPSELVLFLPDGTAVRASGAARCTDAELVHVPDRKSPGAGAYARLRGSHDEGDPASLVGVVEATGAEFVVRDATVILGSLSVLRRRVALTWLGVSGLLAIAVAGAASVVLLLP